MASLVTLGNDRILLVDFAGTLIKPEVIEEANEFRSAILKRAAPTKEEHGHAENIYKKNRELVEDLAGFSAEMNILYRQNDKSFLTIPGEKFQNQIATNLFQIGMFQAAKKHKEKVVPDGFLEQLQRIQKSGFKLAIVSGVRTDIISGMLAIAKIPLTFDLIIAQPPVLGISNEENMKELLKYGSIEYVIGDKMSDLEPAKKLGAKTIFVTWGHPTGGEEEFADYCVTQPKELEKILLGLNSSKAA